MIERSGYVFQCGRCERCYRECRVTGAEEVEGILCDLETGHELRCPYPHPTSGALESYRLHSVGEVVVA